LGTGYKRLGCMGLNPRGFGEGWGKWRVYGGWLGRLCGVGDRRPPHRDRISLVTILLLHSAAT